MNVYTDINLHGESQIERADEEEKGRTLKWITYHPRRIVKPRIE